MFNATISKVTLCAAGTALAAMTAAGPAMAAPDSAPATPSKATAQKSAPDKAKRTYYGRVIAKTGLLVRNAPNQGGKVVGNLAKGSVVSIECKVNGQWIDGNPRWYKLSNGTYAWASARYIANIGAAPHWCWH